MFDFFLTKRLKTAKYNYSQWMELISQKGIIRYKLHYISSTQTS